MLMLHKLRIVNGTSILTDSKEFPMYVLGKLYLENQKFLMRFFNWNLFLICIRHATKVKQKTMCFVKLKITLFIVIST